MSLTKKIHIGARENQFIRLANFAYIMKEHTKSTKSRGVITVACGKQIYFELAASLARSFEVHHADSSIEFAIATDNPDSIPQDVRDIVRVHKIDNPEVAGFELKLYLDHYTPFSETLFIDADCLVTRPLEGIFDQFSELGFTAVGCNLSEGDWSGDIATRCKLISTDYLPIFMGAIYYFDDSEPAKQVFQAARSYVDTYDEMGIVRLRNSVNEEPLISMGMALNNFKAVPDTGEIKCDAMSFEGPYKMNIFKGTVEFCNPVNVALTSPKLSEAGSPAVAHFNDAFSKRWEYKKEALVLRLHFKNKIPVALATPVSVVTHELPGRLALFLKRALRPMFHRIFGVRKVKANERI